MDEHQTLSVADVARYLKLSRKTVYIMINEGKIQACRTGREYRVDATELVEFKKRNRVVQKATTN